MASSKAAQGVVDGDENEQKRVLDKIWSVLMLRKCMAERKMRFFGHIKTATKTLIQGKTEGRWQRGRPGSKILKEWTKLDTADASQLATDRERWREQLRVTAAQIAPPD